MVGNKMPASKFPNASPAVLLVAAMFATVIRIMIYIITGDEGSHLRNSIASMGISVVFLELAIVISRLLTMIWLHTSVISYAPSRIAVVLKRYPWLLFISLNLIATFVITLVPKLIFNHVNTTNEYVTRNAAALYIHNRPFEALPILAESVTFLTVSSVLAHDSILQAICMAIIAVIIAIHDIQPDRAM